MIKKKPDKQLEIMYRLLEGLDQGLLLAGLSVLVRDTADYLHEKGYTDPMSEEFRSVYLAMYNNDRYYWEQFGKDLYQRLPDAGLPCGIVAQVAACTPDIKNVIRQLCAAEIERESTRAPGWFFFRTYTRTTQEILLDGSSLDNEKARVDAAQDKFEIVAEYVAKLTSRSEIGDKLWRPVMLYVSLLIIKTYFETFEEA